MQHALLRAELAALAAERAEMWSDAGALAHVEADLASLEHRWQRAAQSSVTLMLTCIDGHVVRGRCRELSAPFIVIDSAQGPCAVGRAHLVLIRGLPPALAGAYPDVPYPRHLLSADGEPVDIALLGELHVRGRITSVSRDHINVDCADGDSVTVPVPAIIRIRWNY